MPKLALGGGAKASASPVFFKRVRNGSLLGLSVLAAGIALLGFPSSNSLLNPGSELGFLNPTAAYLQGGAQTTAASGGIRVADQLDEARSQAIRLSKDELQIAQFLSKKYRLASSEVEKYVYLANLAGKEKNLEQTLILAVMSIESNLNAITESPVKAQGLMQVMTAVHIDKLANYGGQAKVFDPQANIMVGATILADCIKLGGSVEMGLKCYVGATGPSDGGYAAKVLAEKERIEKARLGVFDFTANNKVLQDLGLIAPNAAPTSNVANAGIDFGALSSPVNGTNNQSSPASTNAVPSAMTNTAIAPLATPTPAHVPNAAHVAIPPAATGVLPAPQAVTLPAPLMSAAAIQNPNVSGNIGGNVGGNVGGTGGSHGSSSSQAAAAAKQK